jgi:ATP-dependent RNA helicase DHX29
MGRGGEDSDNGMATHIIIDEVHERSLDSDLLCLVLKLMHANMPNLRLLLMSATLQVRRALSEGGRGGLWLWLCVCSGGEWPQLDC